MATVLTSPMSPRILYRSQNRSAPREKLPKSSVAEPAPSAPSPHESAPPAPGDEIRSVADDAPLNRVNVAAHPAAQHALSLLRSKPTQAWEFRTTCNQLLMLLAMDATRSLPLRDRTIETNHGAQPGHALAKPVVFLSVTRDGLGLSHTISDCLPGLLVGGISIERTPDHSGFQSRLHLPSAPALSDSRVILFDPVVSTAAAAGSALRLVRRLGATDISLLSFVISSQGLLRLQADYPELTVWTAAVDSAWDPKRHPTTLLGNFRERWLK